MAFKYKRRDPSTVDKRASQQGGDFVGLFKDEYQQYKVKKGDNWIRILPPTWDAAEHYGLDVWVHYSVGPTKETIVCNHKMYGKKCAVCDSMARMAAAGDETEAAELKPKKRVAVWMLDRDEEKKGPQVYAMPWTLDRDIAKLSKDKRTGAIYYLDDPREGYDLSFEKTGEKVNTKYEGVQLMRDPSSVSSKWLEFIEDNPLDQVLLERTYAEVKAVLTGGIDEDDVTAAEKSTRGRPSRAVREEEDEDPLPPRRRRDAVDDDEIPDEPAPRRRRVAPVEEEAEDEPVEATPRRKKPAPVEEEEEDEPAPRRATRRQPEPEEEDEAPAPRRATRRPAVEEEEEEPAPARRKATRRAVEEPEEEDEPAPPRRATRRAAEPEEEEDNPPVPARRRARAAEPEPEEEEDPRAELRRKLAAKKARAE